MGRQVDGKSSLDASANGKATLATSRRSFIAGWKLCAGVALGLCLTGRSSLAQRAPPGPCVTSACSRCFLPGTRIRTPEGEINIEELQIGDNVLTASGEAKRIKFIGRTKVARERAEPWKNGEGPVKISRFAIDGKAPHSDLYISPGHAIYIDGVLIPASSLVNGVTIVADAKPEALSLTLFHIELDTHEAILAEGLAVESFRRDNRLPHAFWFDNADEYVRLYGSPGEPPTPFAPTLRYRSSRQELASHVRSALAPVCDFRKPIEKVRDRIVDRLARAA
jgi:Hint domain